MKVKKDQVILMDGQISVPGDKANLSNVLDVTREYMVELVRS